MIYAKTLAHNTNIPTIGMQEGQPGDAVFCHSNGFVGWAIRTGQWLRHFGKYGVWSHIAALDEPVYDYVNNQSNKIVDWSLIQAGSTGVTNNGYLSDLNGHSNYEIVPLTAFPDNVPGFHPERKAVMRQLNAEVGVKYGWFTIASIIFNMLTPKFIHVNFRRENTWICSALYSWALHAAGGTITTDVYQRLPAQVAQSADK